SSDVSSRARQTGDEAVRNRIGIRRHDNGIVEVACLAVRVAVGPPVTITSSLRRTNSAAISASPPTFPSPYRYSITRLLPSTYPSARSPCRKASSAAARPVEELLVRNPIRGILAGCCARALNPRTNANVGAKIDDRTSFCIAHLVFEAITHAVIAKTITYQRSGTRFIEGKT